MDVKVSAGVWYVVGGIGTVFRKREGTEDVEEMVCLGLKVDSDVQPVAVHSGFLVLQ